MKFNTSKEWLKFYMLSLLSAIFFVWLYFNDFTHFYLPMSTVERFYLVTAVMVLLSTIPLLYLNSIDRKSGVEQSRTRNAVKYMLGSLWLIDGILQMQPQMPFGFSHFVVLPAIQSLPGPISTILYPAVMVWNSHGIVFDALASTIQLFIGACFILSRSTRVISITAVVSMIWGVVIWVMAEGMGAVFQSSLSLISGFPGAALIYVIVSALLLSRLSDNGIKAYLRGFLFVFFILSAIIQALPFEGYWSPGALSSIPSGMVLATQPVILSTLHLKFSIWLSHNYVIWNTLFSLTFLVTGILWILRSKASAMVTAVLMLFIWFLGQDFGVFGMYGTDPNTGLPVILFSFAAAGILAARSAKNSDLSDHPEEAYSS